MKIAANWDGAIMILNILIIGLCLSKTTTHLIISHNETNVSGCNLIVWINLVKEFVKSWSIRLKYDQLRLGIILIEVQRFAFFLILLVVYGIFVVVKSSLDGSICISNQPIQHSYTQSFIKMKTASLLLSLAASASAFAPTSTNSRASVAVQESKADLEALAGELNPLVKFYDPLNLAEAEFWGCTNEETIGFLRHAEIK